MKTAPKADALEKLVRLLKQLDDRIEVYVLPSDPEGPVKTTTSMSPSSLTWTMDGLAI